MTQICDAKLVEKEIRYIHETIRKLISPPDHFETILTTWKNIGEILSNASNGIESIHESFQNLISPIDNFNTIFTAWRNIGETLAKGTVELPDPFNKPDVWHNHDMGSLFYKLNTVDGEMNNAMKFKDEILEAIFLNYPILKMHINDYLKHASTTNI